MAEITQDQFDLAFIRRSQEDHKRILDALAADGSLTITEAVEPPPEVVVDENGEEVEVPGTLDRSGPLVVKVDAEEKAAKEAAKEAKKAEKEEKEAA